MEYENLRHHAEQAFTLIQTRYPSVVWNIKFSKNHTFYLIATRKYGNISVKFLIPLDKIDEIEKISARMVSLL